MYVHNLMARNDLDKNKNLRIKVGEVVSSAPMDNVRDGYLASAFTVAELGDMLPVASASYTSTKASVCEFS